MSTISKSEDGGWKMEDGERREDEDGGWMMEDGARRVFAIFHPFDKLRAGSLSSILVFVMRLS
jgi:hypothetical protein